MKSKVSEKFKVSNINDLELLYSVLREQYPSNEIEIQFNWNTKEYTINVTDKTYCFDPEIPVDLDIQVVYGDSVTGDTPLLLKKDNLVYIETIGSIFDIDKKQEYPGFKMFDKTIRLEKEFSTTDYQVWSDIGWIDIKKVIRHRCDKKIYRVLTHTGCIDVTEDHSLITDTLEPIKPKDLKVGDSLLHSFPTEFIENNQTIVKMKKDNIQSKICNTCNIEKDINEFYKQNTMKSGRMNKCRDCDYYKNSLHPLRNIYKNFKLDDYPLTEKEAEVWGFFQGDGSCEIIIQEWKQIKDFPEYEISSFGNVKNIKTNRLLKPQKNGGYLVVSLRQNVNNPITKRIHRLVAETFIENTNNKLTVNHINHNTFDNRVENLEWCNMNEQNIHKNKNMKNINGKKVIQYDLNMNYINTFDSVNDAMRITKIPASSIIYNCNGFNENCYNFIWKYKKINDIENEIWKEIKINDNTFIVSNKGRVKSKNGIISYGSLENTGYYRVKSIENGKQERISVHVLVAKAFIPNTFNYNIVNHIDSDKKNNCVENLEWCTQSQNMLHHKNKENKECINEEYVDDEYINNDEFKYDWYICNNDLNRLNYFKDILESVEPIKFEILDTLKSSGVYKLVPKGSIKYMVDKYRNLFYYQKDCNADGDKYKIVPNLILNASKEIKMAYWKGYYEADGAKTKGYSTECPSFAVKGKIGAQCMYYLMKSIGYNMYINLDNHPKKQEIYFLNVIRNVKKDSTLVKKIIDKGNPDDYVYDLETNIGRFGAGVGKLQLKNTDSIFVKFKYNRDDFERNRRDTFRLATVCGDNLTNDIFDRKPIELEFEKVFHPFILLTKKRYIANKFENTKDPFDLKGVDAKGIALTRRDYFPMVKKCYKKVIDTILQDTNKEKEENKENKDTFIDDVDRRQDPVISSTKVYLEYIDDIFNYKIPVDDLVVSAMLAASYKTRPVHVQLAEKLKSRKEEVQVGSRIPYIYIETDDLKKQKSELGEDPKYAKKNNLKYNRSCYLEQLAKPILGFYKVVLKDREKLLDHLINYTNEILIKCGGKKLSPSDFKIED